MSALEMIEAAFPDESTRPQSAKRVLEIGRKLKKSPALMNWLEEALALSYPCRFSLKPSAVSNYKCLPSTKSLPQRLA